MELSEERPRRSWKATVCWKASGSSTPARANQRPHGMIQRRGAHRASRLFAGPATKSRVSEGDHDVPDRPGLSLTRLPPRSLRCI